MPLLKPATIALLTALLMPRPGSANDGPEGHGPHFDEQIAPLLARRCLGCHSGTDPKGGLDLTRRESALRGGESGAALAPGDPDGSLLWQYIRDGEMPPRSPLQDAERQALKRWIAAGLPWDSDIDPLRYSTDARAGYDWWSLQPLQRPTPPQISGRELRQWLRNDIDAFVAARLVERGLTPSVEADPRTLARRLAYDLTGLPPAPGDLESLVNAERPAACDDYANQLLASEHYGERWARHWLDVARFGESQGFERDKVRPNAWRYRDWVVQALNRDLPYDQFARLQLAGDVLTPDDADAVTATGFLVAGPYDEVGQQQQSAAMKAVVRQDEMEDIIGTVGQTFLGLTVNCARCHDHKFDPISQTEYYRLSAALGGVRHGERRIDSTAIRAELAAARARQSELQGELDALEQPVRDAILAERQRGSQQASQPRPLARWTFDVDLSDAAGTLHGAAHGQARVDGGSLHVNGKTAYVATEPIDRELRAKTLEAWVRLDRLDQRGGGVISVQTLDGSAFDAIVFGEREPRRWMAGSEGFVRTRSLEGPEETDAASRYIHLAIVYGEDGTVTAYRDGALYGTAYAGGGPVVFPAGKAHVLFGLRHGATAGGNRALAGMIDEARLYDRALTAEEIALSAGRPDYVSPEQLLAAFPPDGKECYAALRAEAARCQAHVAALEEPRVYAVTPREPEVAHVLLRGNPATPGAAVSAGGIGSLSGGRADFGLAADAPDAERRIRLAQWITDRENPLFARVIVNRVWHYHFGAGLVDTPNDFGFNGGRPSHPELLDYLAAFLIDNGWRLKPLHRLIVTSATYRQASRHRPECAAVDGGNRLLWRKDPVRLEAETLRDAILTVAGQLNQQVGGPPYQDFKTFTFNSQFYEMIDPVGPEFHRRTLYRTWLRSGRNPLLDTFDCPDPSTTSPKRAVTTTPVQSLALLNNSFVLRMAEAFAERAVNEAGADAEAQVRAVYHLAYGREPEAQEREQVVPFVAEHGLAALCRVVLNSNEFLYVD